MLPFLTLEEHYGSTKLRLGESEAYRDFPKPLISKLENLGEERIKDLDSGDVSIQVISHVPHDAPPSECRIENDDLATEISKHSARLRGFAMLPMEDPKAAAEELARCVKEHGFLGALVNNHLRGEFYDAGKFWPVFEKAQELDVPIYLHPCYASESMLESYKGNYDDQIAKMMSAFGWGWHVETGLHILRLFASGLFDRFPKLKIVIGHMGELLPFQLDRVSNISRLWGKRDRGLKQVWKENIWITTSGMFSLAPLACLLQTTTIDHVLYSVDYPFSANETGKSFVEEIRKSGLMDEDGLKKFAYQNAEVLLGIQVTRI